MKQPIIRAMLVAMALAPLGCRVDHRPQVIGYYGPTEPLDALASRINARAQLLPTLRGEGHFQAWIKDNGHTQYIAGDVTLLYGRPDSVRFIGKDPIIGPIFEIAANPQRYWVIARPPNETPTFWTGSRENLNQLDTRRIPVRPDGVMEVLGISALPIDLLAAPSPVLRFNNDTDMYMILFVEKRENRTVAVKEIWYDRKTLLPRNVLLYDDQGRVVLRAYLGDHKPVEVAGVEKCDWPMVATSFKLFFPQTQSKLDFDLGGELVLKRKNVPNDRSFAFPQDDADAAHVINLDEPTSP